MLNSSMRLHMKSIVNQAIENGLEMGYRGITSPTFKGSAEDAVTHLYESVWNELDEVIDFNDEPADKPTNVVGFNTLSAKAVVLPEATESDVPETRKRRHRG